MSLSSHKKDDRHCLERIVVGLHMNGIEEAGAPRNGNTGHSQAAEDIFLDRVRDKARSVAKEIISQALQEAQTLRRKARDEGYVAGVQQGREDQERRIEQLVHSLDREKEKILTAFRSDLVSLTRLAVEKTIKLELTQRRQECLAGLMDEALLLVDSQRKLHMACHPDDKEVLQDLLAAAAGKHPALANCRVRTDPSMEQGGVVVECENGMVDNSLTGRWSSVDSILEKLSLDGEP